ncbi:hypothetical protein B0H63DRAFT_562785 [Podospora didyma]|uniref:Uncharacterized protein n=1 Tax=Podospora didyma TaxID=330526 RepID=A0AAE0KEL9_9PEZI|nr:hypothetical protein B0H63DRAFT_562785 [Podospora didyma]
MEPREHSKRYSRQTWRNKARLWQHPSNLREHESGEALGYISDLQKNYHFVDAERCRMVVIVGQEMQIYLDYPFAPEPSRITDILHGRYSDHTDDYTPIFVSVDAVSDGGPFAITASVLDSLLSNLKIPWYYAEMMAKTKTSAGIGNSFTPCSDAYFRARDLLNSGSNFSASPDMFYYTIHFRQAHPDRGQRCTRHLAVYAHNKHPSTQPVWFVTSTGILNLSGVFKEWVAAEKGDTSTASFGQRDVRDQFTALHVFLAEVSCMNWDQDINEFDEMAFDLLDIINGSRDNGRKAADSETVRESCLEAEFLLDRSGQISRQIAHNSAIIQWLLDIHTDKRNEDLFLSPGAANQFERRMKLALEEYRGLGESIAGVAKVLRRRTDVVASLIARSQAEKMEWAVLQVLKLSFIMRNFVQTVGLVLTFFLPGIFISTLFSTEFFRFTYPSSDYEGTSSYVVVAGSFYIWVASALPLTFVILLVQMLWYRSASGISSKWTSLIPPRATWMTPWAVRFKPSFRVPPPQKQRCYPGGRMKKLNSAEVPSPEQAQP